jgi:ACS family sodium-dependent inorganic phosphate cotransporter
VSGETQDSSSWQRRHTVVLLCFLATFICYIDRVNISVAIIPMAEQFGWSDTQRGLVLSSFFVGYLVTQVLGGWLAGKIGGKSVLGFGVLWWSLFTLLTPMSALASFPILIAARILMGVGEGVAFPATYNLLGRWVPLRERSRAAAFNLSAIPLGTLFAVTVTPFIAVAFGWPAVFYVFGAIGFLWFAFWWYFAADRPPHAASAAASGGSAEQVAAQAERERDRRIPWRGILSKGPVWAIVIGHFANNWGLYVLLSWLPSYFASQLGVNLRSVWLFVAPPWIASFLMSNVAGWIADRMIIAGKSVTFTRKFMQSIGFIGPAVALGALATTTDAVTAVVLLSAALGLASFTFAGLGCNHLDISPRHAGVIFGISNTAATIPGIVGVALTGFLVDRTGTYAAAFYLTAAVLLAGWILYMLLGTGKQILD